MPTERDERTPHHRPSVRWLVEDAGRGGGVESVLRILDTGLQARGVDSAVVSWLPDNVQRPAKRAPFGWLLRKVGDKMTRDHAARATASVLRAEIAADPGRVVLLEPGSFAVARHLVGSPRWGMHVHRAPDLILRPWRHLGGENLPRVLLPLLVVRMWWVGWQQRRTLCAAPFVVTLTPSHTRRVTSLQPRTHEIPNPVDCPTVERDAGPGRKGLVTIGYVGRLSWEKGPDVLVDALARLDGSAGPVWTRVAGAGPMERALRERVERLGVADIEFLGWVDDPHAEMAQTDVLVLPSRAEAFGMVLIEALAAGCHVVACDAGSGVRDVLREETLGTVVPADDPEELCRAIAGAIEDVRRNRRPDPARVKELIALHHPQRVLDAWQDFLSDAVRG